MCRAGSQWTRHVVGRKSVGAVHGAFSRDVRETPTIRRRVLEGGGGRVDGDGAVISGKLLAVESTATLDTLHLLATAVADRSRTFRPRSPLFNAFTVLVPACVATLTADALPSLVSRWVASACDRGRAGYLPYRVG
jgi:hypothetical protein